MIKRYVYGVYVEGLVKEERKMDSSTTTSLGDQGVSQPYHGVREANLCLHVRSVSVADMQFLVINNVEPHFTM